MSRRKVLHKKIISQNRRLRDENEVLRRQVSTLEEKVRSKSGLVAAYKQDLRFHRRQANKSAIRQEMKMSAETGEPFILHGSWVKVIPPNEASATESNRRRQEKFRRARARRLFWQRVLSPLRPISALLREARATSWLF